ncbi:MAG: enoyl-CoA hydratase/isomerase family protein, partial [Saprospiraceae bacterium]
MSGTCNVTKHNDHALLCFGSERHNALSFDLLEQMIESIISLNNEEALKLIVIQSEGDRTFCAGADVKELL